MTEQDRLDRYEDALQAIVRWSEAYPREVFPEPDLKRAHELLKAGGMTLDSISAKAMRHIIEGVGKIARQALERDGDGRKRRPADTSYGPDGIPYPSKSSS